MFRVLENKSLTIITEISVFHHDPANMMYEDLYRVEPVSAQP